MYNETTRLVKVVMPVETEEDILQGETNPILASVNPTLAAESAGTPTDSGAIMLSDTAENLYIAYEVVAMVKDESTGKTHFSQLKWKRLGTVEDEDGYEAKSVADPSGDGEQIGVKGAMRDGSDTSDDDTSDDEPQLVYQFMFESGDLFVAAAADEYPALDGDELQMLNDSSSGGGSGGGAVVHTVFSGSTVTLDKTWQEIFDGDYASVSFSMYESNKQLGMIVHVANELTSYYVDVMMRDRDDPISFATDSASGYPYHTDE